MAKYVGKRIVPVHRGVWDQSQPYEMLSIVLEEHSGDSYISKRAVPAGTAITDEIFWALHSKFSQQIKDMSDQLTETEQRIRTDNDETEAAVKRDNAATKQTLEERVVAAETAMTNQKKSFDQTADALNTRMDAVLSAGTGDGETEIRDARVDAEGTTHDSLGDAIRSIHLKVGEEISNRLRALPFMVNIHDGGYVNWKSGRIENSAGGCYTDRIAVQEGDQFHVLSNGYMNCAAAVLYHNETIVDHYGDDEYVNAGNVAEYDITIPENVNWIQFACVNRSRGFAVTKLGAEESVGAIADVHKEIDLLEFRTTSAESTLDDLVERSVNQFNKEDSRNERGCYYITGGGKQTLDRAAMSHPIFVQAGVTYKWTVRQSFWGGNGVFHYWTDQEGNLLEIFRAAYNEEQTCVVFTPAHNGFIRIKYCTTDEAVQMFCREEDWPESYVPYYLKVRHVDLDGYATMENVEERIAPLATKEDVREFQPNVLYGKIAVFDGDSISAGNSTDGNWATVIGTRNNMDWHNHSVGGGTITSEVYTSSGSKRHWVSSYIDTIHEKYPNVDYLILEGGTNDADLLNAEYDTKFGELNIGDYKGEYDDTTFTGALDTLFYKATQYYPSAKIGFIIAQKMGTGGVDYGPTNKRRKFFLRAIEVCEKWGIPYIDLWDGSPLNPRLKCYFDSGLDSQGNRDAGKAYTDGQHLTAVGYAIISSKIEAWMRTL